MTIDPLLPVWLILLLLFGLLVWSAGIEWRRPLRYKVLRLLACAFAALSLAVIFLRPSYPAVSDRQAIILTGSYSHTVVDSLLTTRNKGNLYHLGAAGYRNSRQLLSYREIFRYGTPVQSANTAIAGSVGRIEVVVGDGLPTYALDSIPYGFHYFPSQVRNGLTEISLPYQTLRQNNTATITGSYRTSTIPAKLYFSGPGGVMDSTQLTSDHGQFSFNFTPRASGRTSYSLTLVDSAGTRSEETVPLTVEAHTPLNIFILQDYPTFEIQHLKNYLTDRGHQVAVRAQLSRNTYRKEFSNRPPASLDRLTPLALNTFDLLIVDPSALLHLPASERSAVADALRNGLGMIVVFNGAPDKLPASELLPIAFSPVASDTTSLIIHGKRIALPATRLKPTSLAGTTLAKNASRILTGYAPLRKGMVGFQLLRETYSVLLAGDSTAYGSLWSPLIDATARPRQQAHAIRVTSEFPLQINEPVAIELISSTTPELFADNVRVPVGEDPIIDGRWHATVWADEPGWHNLRTQTDTSFFYTFNSDNWKALRIARQQVANKMAANKPSAGDTSTFVAAPISLLPFWIAFLIAVGFLWLAPKL